MGVDFSGAPFGEFSELTNKGAQMGNTGKYMSSRAGPLKKTPVLG